MTEFNQRSSAVAREVVESGQPVRVTNRGRAVLRLVPEIDASRDRLEAMVAAGLATPPTGDGSWRPPGKPIALSRPLREILEEVRRDTEF